MVRITRVKNLFLHLLRRATRFLSCLFCFGILAIKELLSNSENSVCFSPSSDFLKENNLTTDIMQYKRLPFGNEIFKLLHRKCFNSFGQQMANKENVVSAALGLRLILFFKYYTMSLVDFMLA